MGGGVPPCVSPVTIILSNFGGPKTVLLMVGPPYSGGELREVLGRALEVVGVTIGVGQCCRNTSTYLANRKTLMFLGFLLGLYNKV